MDNNLKNRGILKILLGISISQFIIITIAVILDFIFYRQASSQPSTGIAGLIGLLFIIVSILGASSFVLGIILLTRKPDGFEIAIGVCAILSLSLIYFILIIIKLNSKNNKLIEKQNLK